MRKRFGIVLGILLLAMAFLAGCGNSASTPGGQGAASSGASVGTTAPDGKLLVRMLNVGQGDAILIHAAAGGVGLAAVELGKAMGARVVAGLRDDQARRELWRRERKAERALLNEAQRARLMELLLRRYAQESSEEELLHRE